MNRGKLAIGATIDKAGLGRLADIYLRRCHHCGDGFFWFKILIIGTAHSDHYVGVRKCQDPWARAPYIAIVGNRMAPNSALWRFGRGLGSGLAGGGLNSFWPPAD